MNSPVSSSVCFFTAMLNTLLFYESLNFHTCSKDVNQEHNNKSSCGLYMHVKSEVTSISDGKKIKVKSGLRICQFLKNAEVKRLMSIIMMSELKT